MNKMPARIWASPSCFHDGIGEWSDESILSDDVNFVRADIVEKLAAALEGAKGYMFKGECREQVIAVLALYRKEISHDE